MGRFRLRKRVVEAPEPDPFFPVPARFNFTRDVVEAAAAADAHRHAMTFVDHEGIIDRRTFREIANDASRWTSLFRSRGLEPGDRIVVLVGRTPLWHSVVLGALKGGFVAVPCSETLGIRDLMDRAAHCGARAVVTDRARAKLLTESAEAEKAPDVLLVVEDLKEELRGQPLGVRTHATAPSDAAFILYTAGTTGRPRGAIHTHASTWTMRLQAEQWLDVRPDDLVWCTAGTGSALFVWNALIGPWSLGSEIVLHQREFSVEERFDLIDRLGVNVLCQPPSEYRQMAEHSGLEQFYLGSVRHAVSTGARLDPEVVDAFRVAFGLTIRDGYGQTENTIMIGGLRDSEIGVGSLGVALPGYDIIVIGENGNEQATGVEGEIALRGRPPSLFAGYWNDPDETAASFLGEWYLTGDRAIRDVAGCLWFVGRADGERSARRDASESAAAAAAAAAEAEAEAARAAAAEQARLDDEKRTRQADEQRRHEQEQATAAAAAAEQARLDDEERTRQANQQRRHEEEQAAAARAAAAEQARLDDEERTRQADEQRRHEDEQAAAAADEEVDRHAETAAAPEPTAASAPAKPSRREEAAARRVEKTKAKDAERRKKLDERRRREEESTAAEKARRDEAEAKRVAEVRAREEEQQRKLDERRRREEESTAAEKARRDEAEAKRVAEVRAREEEQQRKLDERRRREEENTAADKARRDEAEATRAADAAAADVKKREKEVRQPAARPPARTIPDPDDVAGEIDERISADLIARLRAYGHGDSSEDALKDQE